MKRMMKQIKRAGTFILAAMLMFSCTEDLDIVPLDDDSLTNDEAFQDESAYEELIAGVYANLALTGTEGPSDSNLGGIDAGTSQFGRVILYLQTLAADQIVWSYEAGDPGTELQRNILSSQNPIVLGTFARTMATVAFANNFLRETTPEKLDSRDVSEATRADIVNFRAEARLLRALSYYYMMDIFGQANFTTEATPINSIPPVAERAELFSYIESELLEIENDLLEPRSVHGRADKGVAYMILAKIYLNAEVYINENKYAECINYCNQIINSGYRLADEYMHNFMADNNSNSAVNEIIFPLVADGLTTQSFGPTTVMVNGCVGSFEQNGEEVGVNAGGWGGAIRARKDFVELFEGGRFDDDDRNTIISENRVKDISDLADRDSGFIIQKYSNASSTGDLGRDRTHVDTDFPLFRLADVYLMYAEAHLRGGGGSSSEAVDFINGLRSRANNPNLISSSELTLDFLIDERSRELYCEAHRRQDLIRFNLFTGGTYNWTWKGGGQTGIALPSTFRLYPIPALSIAANPNLRQNPGY